MKKLISVLFALSLILSFAGCKDKKSDSPESISETGTTASETAEKEKPADETEKPKSTAIEEAQFEEVTKKSAYKDDGYKFDIKNDKNTVVLEFGGSKAVYHHDGKNVTACEYYEDLGSAEKAAKWLEEADTAKILANDKKVKDVSGKGRYIVYKYNESGFAYHTYEELKNAEELIGGLGSEQ